MRDAPALLLVGTADTKAEELAYLRRCAEDQGARVALLTRHDKHAQIAPPLEQALGCGVLLVDRFDTWHAMAAEPPSGR